MAGVSYQRAPFLAGSGSGSEYFCIIGGNRATIQSKTYLSNSGGVAGYTCLHSLAKYKTPFSLAVGKTIAT